MTSPQPTEADVKMAAELLAPFFRETVSGGGVSYGGMRNAVAAALAARDASARAQEREACAKIAESEQVSTPDGMLTGTRLAAVHDGACIEIAAAIRNRDTTNA